MDKPDNLIYMRSLGCNKNTVDSEVILTLLKERGHIITDDPGEASNIIINTCAFIDEAKEEAIETICELSRYRKAGASIIVTGCFSQMYHKEIIKKLPEVDAVIGIGDLKAVIDAVKTPDHKKDFFKSRIIGDAYREYPARDELLTMPGYAYLKIADGCSRKCAFCLIPLIRGQQRSRDPDRIVEEARNLEKKGVKEIVLVSQDTLSYGSDLNINRGLKLLIESLLKKTGIRFFRLLYLRPDPELKENLDVFENDRVLPYFDVPVQHASEKILKSMNRAGSPLSYSDIISTIRDRFHKAVLRTSIITGYPGETEKDFNILLDFIKKIRFDHLGVFSFSPQKETRAFELKGRVKTAVIEERKKKLMELQRGISGKQLKKNIGQSCDVLIEEKILDRNLYLGRSFHFAPEVDGVFLVKSKRILKPGSLIKAKVTRADDYDLHGVEISAFSHSLNDKKDY
ncbi:MAG TPA: 30S ribosomal protein S12 methylthiotransferase RimO [Spirochaetes bacterium]|nr:30S ribosomal protein S12 methylthiotransferase RimO [Spirochaetota bacterium]